MLKSMKLTLLFVLLATLACASVFGGAPWDGTKGNITVATSVLPGGIQLAVRSTDTSVKEFIVVVWQKAAAEFGEADAPMIKIAVPLSISGSEMSAAKTNFPISADSVRAVYVTEIHIGESQIFVSSQP